MNPHPSNRVKKPRTSDRLEAMGKKSKAEPESVWVVCDAIGQPCLAWLTHRHFGSVPALPKGLDPDYGPYTVRAYRLIPEEV